MCLAVPGKVLAIGKGETGLMEANVSFDGIHKRICIACTPEVVPGDFVLVHAGLAICRLDEHAAQRTLAELRRGVEAS